MKNANPPTSGSTEFQINSYLTLRLERGKTVIYVGGKEFRTCKYLLFKIPEAEIEDYSEIGSIDAAIERYSKDHELNKESLDPETEFWGHCSNLQAWAENNYDTRLLDMRLAFPLLKVLTDIGDSTAEWALKEQIAIRWNTGNKSLQKFLIEQRYLQYLGNEELRTLEINIWVVFNGRRIPVLNDTLLLRKSGIEDLSDVKGLFELSSLERLELQDNQLSNLPNAIGKLTQLESLDIGENRLETLPESIDNLTDLDYLNLRGNRLETLPESIGNLKYLEVLNLGNNNLKTIPASIGNLSSLSTLDLSNNNLKTIPASIGNLTDLWNLYLQGNQLRLLPDSIANIYLSMLDLRNNNLKTIPRSIVHGDIVSSLNAILLDGNPSLKLSQSVRNLIKSLEKRARAI